VTNTSTGTLIKVKIRLGPNLIKDYTALINRGNAEIDIRYNSKESLGWLVNHLTSDDKDNVSYVSLYLQAVENKLELVGTSTGDQWVKTGNVQEKIYTFGLNRAKEAILQAKANWGKNR
jgi:hypothetical protein